MSRDRISPPLTKVIVASVSVSLLLAATFFILIPSAVTEELLDMALIEEGRQVFLEAGEIGCASCHGLYADGDLGIGPYVRGASEGSIRAALDGVEDMAFLRDELTEENIKAVAAYYKYLGRLQLVKTLVKRGRFIPDTLSVQPDTRIQLALTNSSSEARTFNSDIMDAGPLTIKGRETLDIIWTAPDNEGEFTMSCVDCKLNDQILTIVVSHNAQPFLPLAEAKNTQ